MLHNMGIFMYIFSYNYKIIRDYACMHPYLAKLYILYVYIYASNQKTSVKGKKSENLYTLPPDETDTTILAMQYSIYQHNLHCPVRA